MKEMDHSNDLPYDPKMFLLNAGVIILQAATEILEKKVPVWVTNSGAYLVMVGGFLSIVYTLMRMYDWIKGKRKSAD